MTGSTPPSPDSEEELRRLRERVYGPHGTPSAAEVACLHELEGGTASHSGGRAEPAAAEPDAAGPAGAEAQEEEPEYAGSEGADSSTADSADPDSPNARSILTTDSTLVAGATGEPVDSNAERGDFSAVGPRRFPWRAVVSTIVVALAVGGVAFATGFAAGTVGSTPSASDDLPELLLPQTEDDVVTTDPNDSLAQTIDLASTRFIARVDGVDVFLARPSASAGVCLFTRVASSTAVSGVGCSGGTPGQRPGLGYGMVGGLQLWVGEPTAPVTGDPIRLSESVTAYVS